MQNETRNCQNCKNDFTIESDDFSFYEKIKVPPPTFCPECRMIRRLMWRNNRSLYSRVCGLCSCRLISFLKDDGVPVYCNSCYGGDDWDQYKYGRDYRFDVPFFTQLYDLIKEQPRLFQISYGINTNIDYANSIVNGKNLHLSFSCIDCENIFFSENVDRSKNCFDCLSVQDLENSSWNINSEKNYNSHYMYESSNCIDSYFLYDCANCSNCFMSSNLRNQSYYFFNEKLDKEEYLKKIAELKLSNYSNLETYKANFNDLIKSSIHKYANIQSSQKVTGDIILNSKAVKRSFDSRNCENIGYSYRTIQAKDLLDCGWILKGELEYETMTGSGGSYNQVSCFMCVTSKNMFYSIACKNSSDCFGCVGLKNAQYCILNQQYSKDEYIRLVEEIKKSMSDLPYIDSMGRIFKFGEFFPYDLSFFGYNESLAHDFFPLRKEVAVGHGYKWHDTQDRNYSPTILSSDLPDSIEEVSESILGEVIACPNNGNYLTLCTSAYRLVQDEFVFLKKNGLPIPRHCPNCRHYERLKYRNPVSLVSRICMCNKEEHSNHQGKCTVEFETSYAPERPEIVYCEKCYQQEVY